MDIIRKPFQPVPLACVISYPVSALPTMVKHIMQLRAETSVYQGYADYGVHVLEFGSSNYRQLATIPHDLVKVMDVIILNFTSNNNQGCGIRSIAQIELTHKYLLYNGTKDR
jgi:hypothetical protein